MGPVTINKSEDLWKLWHGDTHMIADDHTPWKSKCPTFNMIINKIRDYFKMDIKATRLNLYSDGTLNVLTSQSVPNFKVLIFDKKLSLESDNLLNSALANLLLYEKKYLRV